MVEQKEKYKILIMAILLAGACFLTYYFHGILENGRVFTHFFYVPVILAALWWRRKGLLVAIFLAALLIFSHIFVRAPPVTANDYLRALMFMVIAFIVATLSEKIAKGREALRELNEKLEERVDVQTKELMKANEQLKQDITERKRAEEALREERDKAQKYLDVAEVMFVIIGADQKITLVNNKCCGILGYKEEEEEEEEIIGKNWFDNFIPERIKDEVKTVFQKLMAGEIEADEYFENPVLTKSGEERIIAWHNTVLKDKAGNILGTLSSGEDITERKKAEEALRESEERFRTLTESTSDWIWEVDENAVYTYTSPKIKELLGYEPEEIIGKTPFDLMTPEAVKRVAAEFCAIAEAQKPFDRLENENLHKDGQILVLETSGVPIFDANGNFQGYRGIDRDITERKRAEELLRNIEADWRDSFNSLEDVMLIIDRDYNIENINEVGLKLLGKSKEEVIGKKCYQIISGADGPSEECPCRKSLETKKVESLDRYEERFGKYFSIKSSPIFDKNGEIIKFVDLRRDITKRKRAEEALRIERDNLNNIFETMDDGVYIVNQQYDIQYVNPVLIKDFGPYESRKCYAYFHDLDEVCPWCKNHEVFAGKTVRWEWYSFKNQRTYDLIDTPLKNPDGSISKLEIFRDITERKRAEDQIKASLKEKEVLLREIHHRVKNNLQVVASMLRLQARTIKDKNTIDILSESGNRINAMALIHTQLYESSDLSEINMKGFVDKLLRQLLQSYPVRDTKITQVIHVVDYLLPISTAVPVGLIVNELLTNALKHAFVNRKEGKIEVRLSASETGEISLTVSDDGVGLPEGLDINKSETLGLRLVKILAEDQLQGNLGVIREEGTTFNIKFKIETNGRGG